VPSKSVGPAGVADGIGFFFEGVVAVGVLLAQVRDEAGGEVGGDEEGAPAVALADVDAFMFSGEVEGGGGAGEDDIAEGDGQGAAFEEGGVLEQPGDGAGVKFQDAGVELAARAEGKAGSAEAQAHEGGGEGPEAAGDDADHGGIIAGRDAGGEMPVSLRIATVLRSMAEGWGALVGREGRRRRLRGGGVSLRRDDARHIGRW